MLLPAKTSFCPPNFRIRAAWSMRSKKFLLLLFTSLTLLGFTLSISPHGQGQSAANSGMQKPANVDHIPIVDYENATSSYTSDTDPQMRALRAVKGKRYATSVKGFIADRDTGERPILASRYTAPLPALPVKRSAVVALGEVVATQAYLSDDKTGVYSEFTVSIEEVFKDDCLTPVVPGSLVVTERYGGRVSFPSGRVTLYGNREQGMPRQARHYVFFLERLDQQYSILTAYELLSGRVYPLDGKNAPGGEGSNWAGDAYQGADAKRFLSDVQNAIAEYLRTALEKGVVKQ